MIDTLKQQAVKLAHSEGADAADGYNRVLDQLERKLSPEAFERFAMGIFGEDA